MVMELMMERLLAKLQERNNANAKANQEELLARMHAYHEKRMAMLDAHHKSIVASLGQMEANTKKIEQDPGMIQSVEEHQEIPTEDTAIIPVGELRKWRRVWKLTTEHCQKPKEGTRGYWGSRRRVIVAGKRTSRHATVAWRKRKLLGKAGTQDSCRTACRKKVSRHATVAW
jgi:hypothetical protein